MLAKRMTAIAMASALGAIFSAPLAVADTTPTKERTAAQEEISDRLNNFERDAADMRTDLDRYAASMRGHNPATFIHASTLNDAKDQVNSLGRQLSVLEELSPQGNSLQQSAIREARPHLEAVADHVQDAILMFNENQRNTHMLDFRETVTSMYERADDLYVRVDAITDSEKAPGEAIRNNTFTAADVG